jgi:hypothetical protein
MFRQQTHLAPRLASIIDINPIFCSIPRALDSTGHLAALTADILSSTTFSSITQYQTTILEDPRAIMELPTEETCAKVPIPKPPLLFRYDDLAAHDVYSPASGKYTEDSPLEGLRSTFKQEIYVKLFWARYLGVSDSQMATAMGLSFHSADDPEEYNAASERLGKIVDSMRSKTFGPGGYLAKLVQHTVELHDYQAVVFNLARNEMVFGTACTCETDSERQTREVKQAAYRDAKNDMLAKLAAARSEEVVKAKDALRSLQATSRKVRAKEADIKTARLTLQHHEAQDTPWHPTLEASYPTLLHMPPPKLRYSEQHEAIVELV